MSNEIRLALLVVVAALTSAQRDLDSFTPGRPVEGVAPGIRPVSAGVETRPLPRPQIQPVPRPPPVPFPQPFPVETKPLPRPQVQPVSRPPPVPVRKPLPVETTPRPSNETKPARSKPARHRPVPAILTKPFRRPSKPGRGRGRG
ncbi:alpha carbonic anhydrase 8-like [Hyalella azteca]|uniref:Alpha carbonic anhydrase 8-like n=1 Tax=Hyalella azteca TaxID=294128 RepID=A0A8B7NJX2_HYAAZ|nr:alpha carbonic anhydrase 8-like [Hyalella azteca]